MPVAELDEFMKGTQRPAPRCWRGQPFPKNTIPVLAALAGNRVGETLPGPARPGHNRPPMELSGSGSGRVPPQNLDAERSTLGGVLVKPSAIDELLTGLVADDFFLPAHREVFDAMLAIDKRRQPIDIISLADELRTRG